MRRTFLSLCVAGLLTALAGAPASAATLRIDFTDFNVAFDGYSLTDSNTVDDSVDALETMDFFLDGVSVGSLTSDIFADLFISVDGPIPASGGAIGGGPGSYFALHTTPDLDDHGAAFMLDGITLFFNKGSNSIGLSGFASGALLSQILPFNLALDPSYPVDVVFSFPVLKVQQEGGYITRFESAGSGTVQGEGNVVPEPTSMMLLGTGLLGAAAARRRAARNAPSAA